MELTGLPGELGLVWATAMITNTYGAMLVYVSIAGELSLTTADATILTSMIVIAHALPIEGSISKKAGVKLWFTLLLRMGGALIYGMLLYRIFSYTGILQSPALITWKAVPTDATLATWGLLQLKSYIMIFGIIYAILLVMEILKVCKILEKIDNFLEPYLEKIGMSKNAAPLAMIGLTVGISFGGGLIISHVEAGDLSKKDTFISLNMMGLSHSLIEDTLVMMSLGGALIGLLFGRVLFTIIIISGIIMMVKKMSEATFEKWFICSAKKEEACAAN
jgi:spore maturation protein SpmB